MELVWYNITILSAWHVGFIYALVNYVLKSSVWELSVLWIGLWYLSGLGITAGAHRLWAHRSYSANDTLRWFLMCCNAMAFQGSILEWSKDHRIHHKGSETDADPHNANRGFFFAHCGWVMVRKHPQVIEQGKKLNHADLLNDQVVMTQDRHYLSLAVLFCYVLPTVLGYVLFDDASGGFWIGGVFRHVFVLHMTWCVNSVAHLWGDRPYADIHPAENIFVSIGAIGEGWHNYHHKYPSDYATSEFGITSGVWNPTKLFIDVCAYFGWAWDLKRSRTAKATREKRLAENPAQATSTIDRMIHRITFGRTPENIF